MDSLGWKGLAYGERGFRNLTNSKKPVLVPEDMKGLKIRLMQNPVYVDSFKALVPMPSPWHGLKPLQHSSRVPSTDRESSERDRFLQPLRIPENPCDHKACAERDHHEQKAYGRNSPRAAEACTESAQAAAEHNRAYDNEKEEEGSSFLKTREWKLRCRIRLFSERPACLRKIRGTVRGKSLSKPYLQ